MTQEAFCVVIPTFRDVLFERMHTFVCTKSLLIGLIEPPSPIEQQRIHRYSVTQYALGAKARRFNTNIAIGRLCTILDY